MDDLEKWIESAAEQRMIHLLHSILSCLLGITHCHNC